MRYNLTLAHVRIAGIFCAIVVVFKETAYRTGLEFTRVEVVFFDCLGFEVMGIFFPRIYHKERAAITIGIDRIRVAVFMRYFEV